MSNLDDISDAAQHQLSEASDSDSEPSSGSSDLLVLEVKSPPPKKQA